MSDGSAPKLGKYRVLQMLGAGAMGVVYLAHDPSIDRKVAIKTIRKHAFDPRTAHEVAERFRREAIAAGRLSHPGIVAVYDYGEEVDAAYIVMEYAPGDDLERVLASRSMTLPEIGSVMRQILEALGYAHAAGVIHRDIKPSNILMSGRVKIMDFGIALVREGANLTQAGSTLGTPAYMAPELFMGQGADPRSDLFAAGVLFLELLTGTSPFAGASVAEIAYRVCHTQPPLPSSVRPELGTGFDEVVSRALAKSREARFQSAHEMWSALNVAFTPYEATVRGSPSISDTAPPSPAATQGPPSAIGVSSAPTVEARVVSPGSSGVAVDALERVTQALASHVGPIARVLVRKASADTTTYRELCLRLAERLANDDERRRFLRQVGVPP